jgi:hypothetical protein
MGLDLDLKSHKNNAMEALKNKNPSLNSDGFKSFANRGFIAI